MTPFEESYSKIHADARSKIDAWRMEAEKAIGGPDVVRGVASDKQLEPLRFCDLLERLATRYEAECAVTMPREASLRSLENTCKEERFRLKGDISKVHDRTVLGQVLNVRDLKEIVCDAMGYARVDGAFDLDSAEDAWRDFWHSGLKEEEMMNVLSNVEIFSQKHTVWVYFDGTRAEAGSTGDPLAGQRADDHCNALGLPSCWRKYGVSENLYKILYTLKGKSLTKIPTVADANAQGWNPYFRPAEEERGAAKWGRTRPLGEPWGSHDGLPEAVHGGGTLARADLASLPENLGRRMHARK